MGSIRSSGENEEEKHTHAHAMRGIRNPCEICADEVMVIVFVVVYVGKKGVGIKHSRGTRTCGCAITIAHECVPARAGLVSTRHCHGHAQGRRQRTRSSVGVSVIECGSG